MRHLTVSVKCKNSWKLSCGNLLIIESFLVSVSLAKLSARLVCPVLERSLSFFQLCPQFEDSFSSHQYCSIRVFVSLYPSFP